MRNSDFKISVYLSSLSEKTMFFKLNISLTMKKDVVKVILTIVKYGITLILGYLSGTGDIADVVTSVM